MDENVSIRFMVTVTPKANERECYIDWGDGDRTVCTAKGDYFHEYDSHGTFHISVVNAAEFNVGTGEEDDPYRRNFLQEVEKLADGLESIGDRLFEGARYLTNAFRIPDSVRRIGERSFYDANLKDCEGVRLPDSIDEIRSEAFVGSDEIAARESDPEEFIRNWEDMFSYYGLKFSNFPKNGLSYLGDLPFGELGCIYDDYDIVFDAPPSYLGRSSLPVQHKVVFSYDANSTRAHVFNTSLGGTVEFDGKVDSISTGTFSDGLGNLHRIVFKKDVSNVATGAFGNPLNEGSYIGSVSFDGDVDTIEDRSFLKSKIFKVSIGGNVDSIGNSAFSEISGGYTSQDGFEMTVGGDVGSTGVEVFANSNMQRFAVGGNVGNIGRNFFALDREPTIGGVSVEIGGNVGSIDDEAFWSYQPGTLSIGGDVGYIGTRIIGFQSFIFENFNLYIGGNVGEISDYAVDAMYIGSVEICGDVGRIGNYALMVVMNQETQYDISVGHHIGEVGTRAFGMSFEYAYGDWHLHLGTIDRSIGSGVFEYCDMDKVSFTLGETLNSIGEYAFYDTSNLQVSFPAGLKRIGKYAFSGSDINSAELHDANGLYIEEGAFYNSDSLQYLTLGDGVTFEDAAFANCTNLSHIEFHSLEPPIYHQLQTFATHPFQSTGSNVGFGSKHAYRPSQSSTLYNDEDWFNYLIMTDMFIPENL